MKLAPLAVAVASWHSAQARDYRYRNGCGDGYNRATEEGRKSEPRDYHAPVWQRAGLGFRAATSRLTAKAFSVFP